MTIKWSDPVAILRYAAKLERENKSMNIALTKLYDELFTLKHKTEAVPSGTNYRILNGRSMAELDSAVRKAQKTGWVCQGGVSASFHVYYQAMVWEGNNG